MGLVFLALWLCPPEMGNGVPDISLDRLREEESTLLHSILKKLDPVVTAAKTAGAAALLTWDELYAPLTVKEVAFCEEIRRIDPATVQGSSRRLPFPSAQTQFIRMDNQVIWPEGKRILLDTQYLPRSVWQAYQRMMAAMEEDLGKRLLVESGYRSPAYQLYLFLFYLPKHSDSIRETNRHVALPGFSEHGCPPYQAIDFITPEGINGEDRPEEFEELQEYGWLQARAREFGFFLSYPRSVETVSDTFSTGSAFEPWHWHYEAMGSREG